MPWSYSMTWFDKWGQPGTYEEKWSHWFLQGHGSLQFSSAEAQLTIWRRRVQPYSTHKLLCLYGEGEVPFDGFESVLLKGGRDLNPIAARH